jgi:hypothetical protein
MASKYASVNDNPVIESMSGAVAKPAPPIHAKTTSVMPSRGFRSLRKRRVASHSRKPAAVFNAIEAANAAAAPSPREREIASGTRCHRLITIAISPSSGATVSRLVNAARACCSPSASARVPGVNRV